jgi:hypothetical protein
MTRLNEKKLKLKYLRWQRDALYQDDSISVSGFFVDDEIKLCEEKFKLQLLNRLDLEVYKMEREIIKSSGG